MAAFPRLVVHAGRDSSAAVIEVQVSAGSGGLVVPVTERATYDDPRQPSHGMLHVLVGGTPLVRDGRLDTTVLPGRPLRGRGR